MVVRCKQKRIVLKHSSDGLVTIEANRTDYISNLISTFSVQKLIRKGAEAYLAYILDTQVSESKITQVATMREFVNVFLEELPRISSIREVEFIIDFVLGSAPIFIAPSIMAPSKLKEFKSTFARIDRMGIY